MRIISRVSLPKLSLAVLLALPLGAESRADVSASGDFSPSPLGDAGGPLASDLIIGNTGVSGFFMDAAPPLFDPLAPLEAPNVIVGNATNSIGAMTLEDFLGGDIVATNDFIVGNAGQGFLDMNDSASVTVGSLMTIGAEQEGLGVATVNGQGTRIITLDLVVGDLGVGNLEIKNRAMLISENGYIGNGDGSVGTVLVTGVGSRWSVGTETPTNTDSRLTIGNLVGQAEIGLVDGDLQDGQGQGYLKIADRGIVQVADEVIIGPSGHLQLETKGRLRILPTSEALTGNEIDVTDAITNQGVISGDGYVDFVGVVNGPTDSRSSRALTFVNTPSGEIRNTSNAYGLGSVGTIATNQREKLVFNGNAANGDSLTNFGTIESLGGEMEFNVPVTNNLEIIARDAVMRFPQGLINDGTVILGETTTVHGTIAGAGSLQALPNSDVAFIGDLTFSTTSIVSLVIGDNASSLLVSGIADLGSATLGLSYSSGAAPQVGDTFQILQAVGGITGTFSNDPVPAGGALWDIDYIGDSVFATYAGMAAAPIGADFNGDGIVDALDLAIWQANYGRNSPPDLSALGDADGDGDVDGRDFMIIQRRWGMSGALTAAVASVPEPGTIVLLLAAALGMTARRR